MQKENSKKMISALSVMVEEVNLKSI